MALKVSDILEELDGAGILWVDDGETKDALAEIGLSGSSMVISYTERNTLKNAIYALQVLALAEADEFLEDLAQKSFEILEA